MNAKTGKIKYPTKRTVNLAKRESKTKSIVTLVCGLIVIALLCGAVVKFGVVDQFDRLTAAESAYNSVHAQYVDMKDKVADYPEVEQEYRTYSRNWLTGDSGIGVRVDRTEVLDLMEQYLASCGTVRTFLVEDDVILASMSDMNLEEVSAMFAELQRQPIVSSASLTIASTAKNTNEDLDFSITIILQAAAEEDEQ